MSRKLWLALALALCVAVTPSAAVPPAPACKSMGGGPMLGGGWSQVASEADVQPGVTYPFVLARLRQAHPAWLTCQTPNIALLNACSQIVAGQNVQVVLRLTCPPRPWRNYAQVAKVLAAVYIPLPQSNQAPRVRWLCRCRAACAGPCCTGPAAACWPPPLPPWR